MKKYIKTILFVSLISLLSACASNDASQKNSTRINSQPVSSQQSTPAPSSKASSKPVSSQPKADDVMLTSETGLKVYFKAKGARIDKITWGPNDKQIAKDGFTVGRCANRIANAKFTLNNKEYNLTKFSDGSSLHGGGSGANWQGPFANAIWTKGEQTSSSISYSLHSNDGDNGYPGNMDMTVKYTLSQTGELSIEYSATTDADTLCNPTNHLFMALNSNTSYSNIKLWIDADNYTPLKNSIPTGEIASVLGTQFDYTTEKAFDGAKNYDDNYVLNGKDYRKVATMTGTSLGVKVDVYTDRPGLQLYKENNGNICLETQMFPDMINQPTFVEYGTTVLKKGEQFYSKTTYAFSEVK